MKKILIAFAILVAVFIACVYIFIPAKLDVTVVAEMKAPVNGVFRYVSQDNMWLKWANSSTLDKKITGSNPFINAVDISISYGKDSIKTTMNLLRLTDDSIAVQWKCSMPAAADPFTRISRYNEAEQIKTKMDSILYQLKQFVSRDENIYGFTVQESSIKDTFLISTKTNLTFYPQTNDLYNLIDKLKDYAKQTNAAITGYPMYNVTKLNGDTIRLMVAIPVNKELQEAGSIFPIRMVPGRFLTGEVKGGNETVKNAFAQMQLYFAEHNRIAMAIPFAYLITDRMQEPDTTKWVTKIYAPVF